MVFPKKPSTSFMAATTSRFMPAAGHAADDFVRHSDDGCAQSRLQGQVSRERLQFQWQDEENKWLVQSAILDATYQALLGQLATDTFRRLDMAILCYNNSVALEASMMLIRVSTLRKRHAGMTLGLSGVALAVRRALITAIYAAETCLAASVLSASSRTAPNQAHTSKSPCALPRLRMARQHMERNIQADIHTLAVIIMATLIKGRTQYSKCSELCTQQSIKALENRGINRLGATLLCKFDEQMNRRCIQTPISCLLGTGRTTRPTISSVSILDSGEGVTAIYQGALQACSFTPNKEKAPSAHEHRLDHMLDSAVSDRAHVRQRNLTEERSDKPRSNTTPATNSSNDTTRDPVVQNKLNPDGANENHSDPDACVDDRDASASKGQAKWYMATGAARHATGDSSLITNLVPLEQQPENNNGDHQGLCVHAADGTPMPILGHGSVVTSNVVLPDVFYVPGLLTNLVSVGRLAGLDYSVGFGRGTCIVSSADGETVVGRAHAGKDGLYEVEFLRVPLDMR